MTDRKEPIGDMFCKGSIHLGSGCRRCGRCAIDLDLAHAASQAEVARLRGALERCREALDSCTPGDYSTGHVIYPYYDPDAVNAALDVLEALK